MFCQCGYWATALETQYITCPLCKRTLLVKSVADQGREAWAALHAKQNPTEQWFYREWLPTVPAYGCKCREHFNKLLASYPPDFDDFATWAVFIHNKVNFILDKPQWPYSDAA